MTVAQQSLISPTANPELEKALRDRVDRRSAIAGGLGELEPLAVRLGLVQNSLTPRFRDPVLGLFASDHGIVVDGVGAQWGRATKDQVQMALHAQLPVSVFARLQGLHLTVVDCGVADNLPFAAAAAFFPVLVILIYLALARRTGALEQV